MCFGPGSESGLDDRAGLVHGGVRIGDSQGKEDFRSAAFAEPEGQLGGSGVGMADVVGFEKAADHGPVFIALGFLGLDEIREGKDVDTAGQFVASGPQVGKVGYAAHVAHNVDPQAFDSRGTATEVDGEPGLEGFHGKWRHGNDVGAEFG